jgi:hypothetical protein
LVVDHHVEMKLLGPVGVGPPWSAMVENLLKCNSGRGLVLGYHNPVLAAVGHRQAQEFGIELSQCRRVSAVDDHMVKPSDHAVDFATSAPVQGVTRDEGGAPHAGTVTHSGHSACGQLIQYPPLRDLSLQFLTIGREPPEIDPRLVRPANRRIMMAEAAGVMRVKLPEGVSPDDDVAILSDFVVPLVKAQAGFKNGTWARDG